MNNNSIGLRFLKNNDLPKSKSKYLGCPSLPEKWLDDTNLFEDNDIFICQINLEDLFEYSIPCEKKGILYFFVNFESKSGKVLFSKNENLVTVDFNEGSLIGDISNSYAIEFDINNEVYLDGCKLFGQPVNNQNFDEKNEILLLQIDTLQDDNILFPNEDYIFQFIIKNSDFINKDFSKIKFNFIAQE